LNKEDHSKSSGSLRPRWSKVFYLGLAWVGDLFCIVLAFIGAYQARFEWKWVTSIFPVTKGTPTFSAYLAYLPAALVLWMGVLLYQKCYRLLNVSALDEFIRMIKVSVLSSLLVMASTFLYRGSEFSRLTVVFMGGITAVLLFAWREALKITWIRAIGKQRKRVLIIGGGRLAMALEKVILGHKDSAVLRKQNDETENLLRSVDRSRIDEVIIADSDMNHKDIITLASRCEERNVLCRIIPNLMEIRMGEVILDDSLGIPSFRLKPIPLHGMTFLIKRVFDCTLSLIVLSVLSLPLLIIAVLIKLDSPGPIFFKQPRMGHKGKPFLFYKFRTMVQESESLLEELKAKSDRGGPLFKMKNDPRITRIGKYLRRYSLDEMPQLLNVLRGEMSLVGPRPQVLWEAKAYDEWAKKRLNVLPGITGLWQVSGRAELTYEEMIDLDIYYLEHWSPGLDLKILLRTLPTILGGKGAY